MSAQVQFYGVGDLPGGGSRSEIRDAILTPNGIVAVGTASQYASLGDTPVKWTPSGGLVALANDFSAIADPAFVAARVISADGNVIAGSAKNGATTGNRGPALWDNGGATLTRLGFLGGTPTFFPNVGVNGLSADGSVAYGFTRGPNNTTVAFRYTVASGMQSIGFLRAGDTFNFTAAHSASADGLAIVGNSGSINSLPGNEMQAYRYDYTGSGATGGVMTQLPGLPGGTWNFVYSMTPDSSKMVGVADSAGNSVGELVRWTADGSIESLGAPDGIAGFSNFGGVTADGETIVVGTSQGVFIRNPSGWFNLATLLTASGVDLTGWAITNVLGMSTDGRLIYGAANHNGNIEGYVMLLPIDFMKALGDETPPVLTVPADLIVEATSASGAVVNFAATAEDAVDGAVPVVYSVAPGSTFPLGTTTVNVSATDGSDNVATGSFTVTVRDTTAPTITNLTASPALLWPPNHKMHVVAVTGATSDAVGPVTLRIVGVSSNEPDNGLGDGDTANDIVITGALTASLRAERSGKGTGRIYTISVEAKDGAGNTGFGTVTVMVPKN